jgi:HK97 gp10 family phage protein
MAIRVTIEGIDDLKRASAAIQRAAIKAVTAEVNWGATNVRNQAMQNAPVDTGHLKQSIVWQPATVAPESYVNVGAPYAAFVEFGTGRAGAASGQEMPATYRHGGKPGMYAQPYLFPAWEAKRPEITRRIADAIRTAIREGRAR